MKAIILAGGMGTRLRSVVSDVPKPLAPINSKPFLQVLLDSLLPYDFSQFIISTCYMADKIKDACGDHHKKVPISYVKEESPLGTGGAIRLAISSLSKDEEYVFVLNGDTFLKVDYKEMLEFAQKLNAGITIAVRSMDNCYRYGTLMIDHDTITGFNSAGSAGPGYINGGIYLLKASVLSSVVAGEKFSFERDFLEKYYLNNPIYAFMTDGYFIDIGIPTDYERAQKELEAYAHS